MPPTKPTRPVAVVRPGDGADQEGPFFLAEREAGDVGRQRADGRRRVVEAREAGGRERARDDLDVGREDEADADHEVEPARREQRASPLRDPPRRSARAPRWSRRARARARAMPRSAASLKLLSPRPPTSKTRPARTAARSPSSRAPRRARAGAATGRRAPRRRRWHGGGQRGGHGSSRRQRRAARLLSRAAARRRRPGTARARRAARAASRSPRFGSAGLTMA